MRFSPMSRVYPRIERLESRELLATYTVTDVNNGGAGSLRRAIQDANDHVGLDSIVFDIPGAGVHTISLSTDLPEIDDPVIIDGSTQPGYAGQPLIELDGTSVGASGDGLLISAGGTTVRALVINRFANGIRLIIGDGNRVEGCYIGTDAGGTQARPNLFNGIWIDDSANNVIGGTTVSLRNIISANDANGIFLVGSAATGNTIQGNYIGTDVTGSFALDNFFNGIYISASDNFVGGTATGAGNLLSGNGFHGVHLSGIRPDTQINVPTSGNRIQGNRIGTKAAGSGALGNGPPSSVFGRGVFISDGALDNTVGGSEAGAANVIAYNNGTGVLIGNQATQCPPHTGCTPAAGGNEVRANSIFANAALGIDLGPNTGGPNDGVAVNDFGDADSGPNNMQNYPTINFAVRVGASTKVGLTINSTPNTTFSIDVFSNALCDPTRFGEGETLLGSVSLTTNSAGVAGASAVFGVAVPLSHRISATATSPSGDTSEFSGCRGITSKAPLFEVPAPPLPPSARPLPMSAADRVSRSSSAFDPVSLLDGPKNINATESGYARRIRVKCETDGPVLLLDETALVRRL